MVQSLIVQSLIVQSLKKYRVVKYKEAEGMYKLQKLVKVSVPSFWNSNLYKKVYMDIPGIFEIFASEEDAIFECNFKNCGG